MAATGVTESNGVVDIRRESRQPSQDDIDEAPHIVELRTAISKFDVSTIKDLAIRGLWTGETITDAQKFRNPLHTLVVSYISALENISDDNINESFTKTLSVIVDHGVDINEGDVVRNTPLHILCQHCGHSDVIKTLLASGAKVNLENAHQQTPLHLASDNGTIKDVEALLDGGADPNRLDCTGQTPLHYATRYRRNTDVIKSIVGCGANVNLQQTDNNKRTGPAAMHVAIRSDRKENVQLLLELGAKTDVEDSSGQTPLHTATICDITGRITRVLLEAGANPNSKDHIYGHTPLHVAIKRNMLENVIALTEAGASLSLPDLYGESPLHTASIFCQNIQIWIALMGAKNVDIQLRNTKSQTPLDKASRTSNKVAVNVLKQIIG